MKTYAKFTDTGHNTHQLEWDWYGDKPQPAGTAKCMRCNHVLRLAPNYTRGCVVSCANCGEHAGLIEPITDRMLDAGWQVVDLTDREVLHGGQWSGCVAYIRNHNLPWACVRRAPKGG